MAGSQRSPVLSSQSLSSQLPDETVRAWTELGPQYVTEYSNLVAPATVTSASAALSTTDQDVVEDTLCDAEYLLDIVDDLKGEDIPTTEDNLDKDVDVSTERFSRLAAEGKVDPRPVLKTANRVKTGFQQ